MGVQAGVQNAPVPLWRSVLAPSLVALYGVSFLSGFSLGVFNPLIALRMAQQGIGEFWIGATATAYFLMIALAAAAVVPMMVRFGLTATIVGGLLGSALIALLLPLADGLPAWVGLRVALGMMVCLYMIGAQTGLNHAVREEVRATAAAAHGGAFGLGFAVSPLIGSALYLLSPSAAFYTAAGVIVLGALLVAKRLPQVIVTEQQRAAGILPRIRLPAFAGFTYGFFEGAFISLFPLYLLQMDVGIAQGGLALSLFVIGGVLGMGPMSYWGDRLGRERILMLAASVALLAIAVLVLRDDLIGVLAGAVLLGVSLGPVFPLALAMIGARLPKTELAAGSSVFTTWFAYGCAAGPLIGAAAMQRLGPQGLFAGSFVLLACLALWAGRDRPSTSLHPDDAQP